MRLRLLLAALLLSVFPSMARAQSLVDGKVVNGNQYTGAPNVKVHLVNNTLKPRVDKVVTTDDDGYYSFEDVAPGEGYSVAIYSETGKALGFDVKFSLAGNQKHTALPSIDIAKGADASQTRQAGTLLLNDRGIAQGANISNEQLRVLPLYNRTFLALSLIQPGVHDVDPGSPLQGAAFSIAGSRPTSTDFRLNSLSSPDAIGVSNVASSNNQAIPFQVNEAVQDLRVIYAVPDLRYGQGSGGVIDVVTSQGRVSATGAWHGSAFGFFNNDALNGNSPLSVYSNSGFFRAAAYANTPLGDGSEQIQFAVNPAVPGDRGYLGYSPQSYNALYNVLRTLDTACTTSLCAAGSFAPGSVLASQNSYKFPVNQSQFGASAGGPLLNGHLLLFLSYEGTRISNPTPIFERVPTTLDTTPNTADGAIASGALKLLPAPNVGFGTSNAAGVGTLGFYRGTAPNYTNVHNLHIRPDLPLPHLGSFNLGTLSLRYTGQLLDQLHDDTLPANSAYPGNGAFRRAQNQSAAITYNLPFRKHVNILNLAFTQFRVDEVAQDRGFNASALGLSPGPLSTFVLSGIDTRTTGAAPAHPGYMGGWYDSFWNSCPNGSNNCPAILSNTSPSPITPSLDGDFPLARIGAPLSAPAKHRDTEAFLSDTLALHLSARNQLTVGGEYRYQQNFSYEGGLARGLVVSNNIGEFTADSETCISCGMGEAFRAPSFDYELRQPTGYTGDLRSSSFGAYAENRFQPTERLTIDAGIRYVYFGQPLDTLGRLWNFSPANQGLVRQGSPGTYDAFDYQCGAGTASTLDSLYGARRVSFPSGWNCVANGNFFLPQNKHDLTGRAGFSYSPDNSNKTVLRAAAGGYYDHLPASYNQRLLQNRPSPYNVTNPSALYGQNFYSTACPVTLTQCGFGLHTLNLQSSSTDSTFANNQAASGANILYERDTAHLQTPYSVQYSLSVQHQFSASWLTEIAYVGSVNRKLPLIYDSNYTNEFYCTQGGGTSAAPGGLCNNNTFFPIFTESNIGASNYHSLIARVASQQWHGLTLHAAYTFSKSLDDVAGSDFPQSTDSLWSQLFGRQLFGMGNPVAFSLGANSLFAGSSTAQATGIRGQELNSAAARTALQTGGNIPSFNAIQSALTTTGSRPVNVSRYNLPQNPLAFSSTSATAGGDYGPSDFDVRSRAVADFVYNLPDHGHAWARGFLLSGIFTAQSGQPFTIFSGPAYGQVTQRISLNAASPIRITGNPNGYLAGVTAANLASASNTNCTSLYAKGVLYNNSPPPIQPCVGNIGRNAYTGPAFISQDLAVEKSTRLLSETRVLILRAEVFNLFGRANLYNPISEYSLDGVHINPEFGLIRSAHDPRQIQLAVRYSF